MDGNLLQQLAHTTIRPIGLWDYKHLLMSVYGAICKYCGYPYWYFYC